MKKFFLMLMLITFSFPVFAEHHRQHATQFLNQASNALADAQTQLAIYAEEFDSSTASVISPTIIRGWIRAAEIGLANAGELIVDSIDILNDPEGGIAALDITRRLINAPNEQRPYTLLFWYQYSETYLAGVARDNSRDVLGYALRNITEAWKFTDLALWHVNDAIREEIYNDPAFHP